MSNGWTFVTDQGRASVLAPYAALNIPDDDNSNTEVTANQDQSFVNCQGKLCVSHFPNVGKQAGNSP